MPSAGSGRSCIMARREGSRSCEARNGCVGGRGGWKKGRVGDTFWIGLEEKIHDCYPAIA